MFKPGLGLPDLIFFIIKGFCNMLLKAILFLIIWPPPSCLDPSTSTVSPYYYYYYFSSIISVKNLLSYFVYYIL